MKAALIVVDMQRDFVKSLGFLSQSGLPYEEVHDLYPEVEKAVLTARSANLPIFFMRRIDHKVTDGHEVNGKVRHNTGQITPKASVFRGRPHDQYELPASLPGSPGVLGHYPCGQCPASGVIHECLTRPTSAKEQALTHSIPDIFEDSVLAEKLAKSGVTTILVIGLDYQGAIRRSVLTALAYANNKYDVAILKHCIAPVQMPIDQEYIQSKDERINDDPGWKGKHWSKIFTHIFGKDSESYWKLAVQDLNSLQWRLTPVYAEYIRTPGHTPHPIMNLNCLPPSAFDTSAYNRSLRWQTWEGQPMPQMRLADRTQDPMPGDWYTEDQKKLMSIWNDPEGWWVESRLQLLAMWEKARNASGVDGDVGTPVVSDREPGEGFEEEAATAAEDADTSSEGPDSNSDSDDSYVMA